MKKRIKNVSLERILGKYPNKSPFILYISDKPDADGLFKVQARYYCKKNIKGYRQKTKKLSLTPSPELDKIYAATGRGFEHNNPHYLARFLASFYQIRAIVKVPALPNKKGIKTFGFLWDYRVKNNGSTADKT